MQVQTGPFQSAHAQPEVRSALRKIQEQAQLIVGDRVDRETVDRVLLIAALARFCLASMPAEPSAVPRDSR